MSLDRNSKVLRQLRASLCAQFALKQRHERIKWEAEVLYPTLDEWLNKAIVPEPPTDLDITIEDTRQS